MCGRSRFTIHRSPAHTRGAFFMKKTELLDLIQTLKAANETTPVPDLLEQCQDAAVSIGTAVEKKYITPCVVSRKAPITKQTKEAGEAIVHQLESYCENLYQLAEHLDHRAFLVGKQNEIRTQLDMIASAIQNNLPADRKEVVFLPYKASMWDSLETVWRRADADPDTDAYVIPIPYFDKNPDGSFKEEHYEGDLYPEDVPITRYDEYDFEGRHPDEIYIHNPYDDGNYVTSVHPAFYSTQLNKYTECLIYIPYFLLKEPNLDDYSEFEEYKPYILTAGVIYANKTIVQSEDMRKAYIHVLTTFYLQNIPDTSERDIRTYWEKRIVGTGSPKIEKLLAIKKEDINIPHEWDNILFASDGKRKKIVLFNNSVGRILGYKHDTITKIRQILNTFKECQNEVAFIWRPHPLMLATMEAIHPELVNEYRALIEEYKKESWGIYDDSSDMDRVIILCDAYYGDWGSIVWLLQKIGKSVMIDQMYLVEEPKTDNTTKDMKYIYKMKEDVKEGVLIEGSKSYLTLRNYINYIVGSIQ